MLSFNSLTGETTLDGVFQGLGYSGRGDGRNNPSMESVRTIGPIPRGRYMIGPVFDDPGGKGPIVFNLSPVGHNAHGRSGFMVHGDNHAHDASRGCIILSSIIRKRIRDDRETTLEVFSSAREPLVA